MRQYRLFINFKHVLVVQNRVGKLLLEDSIVHESFDSSGNKRLLESLMDVNTLRDVHFKHLPN